MWQEADDALDLVLRSRASADDQEEHDSRNGQDSGYSTDFQRGSNDWEEAVSKMRAESLPHGWEAVESRSTGQVYYFNKYTEESQYDLPTAPARDNRQSRSERDTDYNRQSRGERDMDYNRGQRRFNREADTPWGGKPAYDPKAFLDFDAKACNLESSRELAMQLGMGNRNDKKKRSRSRKKKRKRSSSSSSSSSKSKKRKKQPVSQDDEDGDRVNRIKKAREARRQNAKSGPDKSVDGGTID